MAEAEIKVAVEAAIHKALMQCVQSISDEHGVKVDSAHFKWAECATVDNPGACVCIQSEMSTMYKGGHP
jgi:hypothetical protein